MSATGQEIAERMRARLSAAGIPFFSLKVTPATVVVKCDSRGAAEQFARLFSRIGFAGVVWPVEHRDETKRNTNKNPNIVRRVTTTKRWIVGCSTELREGRS